MVWANRCILCIIFFSFVLKLLLYPFISWTIGRLWYDFSSFFAVEHSRLTVQRTSKFRGLLDLAPLWRRLNHLQPSNFLFVCFIYFGFGLFLGNKMWFCSLLSIN
jgi:hypothetical protein